MDPPDGVRQLPNLEFAADPLVHAWRLYRAGKAPRILITGGQLPWMPSASSEAEVAMEMLVEWGVPREAILVEKESRNTRENAVFTQKLLEEHELGRFLLVTSVSHMPRSVAVFRAVGLDPVPAATDYQVGVPRADPLRFMPDAWSLFLTTSVLKEYLGMAWYRWKGWA